MMEERPDQQIGSTIDYLASRWQGAGPLLPCFSLLARRGPLSINEIAEAAGGEIPLIKQTLQAARCRFDERGRLIDLFGMTLEPTLHRLEIEGKVVFSCCALWAHVIPKLVGRLAKVESVDPASRRVVRLSISPKGIAALDPPEAMATLAVADSGSVDDGVEAAFCRHVRHFACRDSAERFAQAFPARRVVTVEALHEAAQLLHQSIWARLEG